MGLNSQILSRKKFNVKHSFFYPQNNANQQTYQRIRLKDINAFTTTFAIIFWIRYFDDLFFNTFCKKVNSPKISSKNITTTKQVNTVPMCHVVEENTKRTDNDNLII